MQIAHSVISEQSVLCISTVTGMTGWDDVDLHQLRPQNDDKHMPKSKDWFRCFGTGRTGPDNHMMGFWMDNLLM